MKTAGSTDASFLVKGADAGAGRGESLRAGAFVFIEVRERLGPELYRIAVGSRLMTASSKAALEPGALLRAKVERSGDGFILRMLEAGRSPKDAAAQAILRAGLPVDEASRMALAALLGSGMPPEGAALSRVRRAALKAAGREDEADLVELAARMEAKGLAADDAALEALSRSGDGRSGGRSDGPPGGRDSGRDGRGEERGDGSDHAADGAAQAGGFDLERDFSRFIPEESLPGELGAFLKALTLRASGEGGASPEAPGASGGVGNEDLGLFNHAKAKDGGWLLVPFRFALDSVAFAGNFRIQLPYVPGGTGRIEARFDATSEGSSEAWKASLSFGGVARPALRIEAPGSGESSRFSSLIASFESRMAAAGCSVALGRIAAGAGEREGFDLDA
jgi:hypothetical protein